MTEADLFRKIHDDALNLKKYKNNTIICHEIFNIKENDSMYIRNTGTHFVTEKLDARNDEYVCGDVKNNIKNKVNIKNFSFYVSRYYYIGRSIFSTGADDINKE